MKEKVQKVSNLSLSKNIKSAESTNTQKMKNNQARNKEHKTKIFFTRFPDSVLEYIHG